MNSFISWIGGKKLLRGKILKQFPKDGSYKRYIEVFGGAGWVLFSKDKHADLEVYNDVNSNLVNLFRCIKYHPEAVQKELDYSLVSREQFFDCVEQLDTRGMTDIQRAARFFIAIKNSFGANCKTFGMSAKDVRKATDYLKDVSERLSKTVIENKDFQDLIKVYDREDALFYLDPPYYSTEKYYPDRFNPEDHNRLKECLDKIKGKFVLSYNDCEQIRELYKHYHIIAIDRAHNLVTDEGTKPRYKELIIKNFP